MKKLYIKSREGTDVEAKKSICDHCEKEYLKSICSKLNLCNDCKRKRKYKLIKLRKEIRKLMECN